MRCFLAVEVPEDLKRRIHEALEPLIRRFPNLKWVKPENYHITLKFLGEVPEDFPAKSQVLLEQIARTHPPFSLEIHELGAFPNLTQARVLWLRLNGDLQELRRLAEEVDRMFEQLGIPPETREFKAHLTVARARRPVYLRNLSLPDLAGARLPVRGFTLFQSRLHRQGPTYTVLRRYRFHD